MTNPLYREIASRLDSMRHCETRKTYSQVDAETARYWAEHHKGVLRQLEDLLPSGSGIDNGTKIDLDASRPDRIVLIASFHHMDENGYYSGWSDHSIVIEPSLVYGITIRVTGRDRNDVKDFLAEVYSEALRAEYVEPTREESSTALA